MFVDHIRIYAKSGDGGNGSGSFRREAFIPKGGPDGGDGGRGGDIIIKVTNNVDNLRDFFFKPIIKAPRGEVGKGQQKAGRSGKNLTLKVPPGTVIYKSDEEILPPTNPYDDDFEEELPQAKTEPTLTEVADLTTEGDTFILCKGGEGGKGNVRFKSSVNRAPEFGSDGEIGEEAYFYLELRRIADAGLVGFPNAGKSTLLTKLSAARPKVASYPFTTLAPMVGVLDFKGFSRGTVADIPGLIEGAHANVGLGHDFLRHIMRCQLLVFVLDMACTDQRDPVSDLVALRKEISLYNDDLAKQPWLIVANKMDVPESAEYLPMIQGRFPKIEVWPISAETGDGIDALKTRLGELIGSRPK